MNEWPSSLLDQEENWNMRIVHVVDSLDIGGAEMLVCQMCRMQRDRGDEPSVYAISRLGALGEQMRKESFEVRCDLGKKFSHGVRHLYGAFRQDRPEVVHFHNPTPTIYGAAAAKAAGVRRLISTRHSLVAKPHKTMEEAKYAVAALFCDHVVGICEATVNNLKSLHTVSPYKLVRVYNGVAPLRCVAAQQCPPKEGFTLLFVGRLEAVKNLPLLLEAFANALRRNPDLRLWIVGDGRQRSNLESFAEHLGIAPMITFWGQQLEVARFFSGADLTVMSSRSEGLPTSLLQGFSLGVPAVVTDVGGMGELVRLSGGGIAVPSGNPDELMGAILLLSNQPARRQELSCAARKAFFDRFTLQAMVEAYQDLYKGAVRS